MFYGERSAEGRVHQPGCQDHPRPEEPQETGGRKEQVCSILQTSGFDFEMHECWFRSEYSTGFGEIHKISNTTETKQTRSLVLRAYPFVLSGTNGHPRANMTVTHLEVLAGKKGTIGTWSMEKSKAKHAATDHLGLFQIGRCVYKEFVESSEPLWKAKTTILKGKFGSF